MSMQAVASLLQQYNEKSPYKRNVIDSKADQSNKKFGTWSYANMYDALYEKYSLNKNFDVNMWHDAIKLGEQDQYLAFLEQNKDNTLSKQFYDPQYYDYEAMMMEMYLPFADNTKLEKYTQDVYDPASGKWVTEDLGEMTQRQYYEYLLSNTRTAQEQQITKDLEQWRKDQLGWWGQFGHDVLATLSEFGEGLLSGLTGIIDFVAAVGTGGLLPYAMNGFEGNYLDAFVDYFGENGLTAAEKRTVRAALDEYERTHTHFRDIDGNMTGVGKYVAGIANSIGMMVPAIVVNYFTGGTASLAWMGTATFYASIFSNNMYENATNPNTANSPSWLKITNAAVKTGVEAVIEWGLGKILGGTIQNQMIGIGGRNISQGFIKGFSKTSGLKYFFKSAGQEGLEEFLQDFSTNCVDQFTDLIYEGYGNTGVTFQTLVDSFCIGVLSSMFMSGGHVALSATSSAIRNAKNPGSGDLLIETEDGPQKVTGFNRLQYSQILSDFQQAVDELKHGKISAKKNIGLAQEVYGAVSAISQFYSSFDAERIKNCELLLDRVVKAERFEEHYERAASILSPETAAQITKYDKMVKGQIKTATRERARTFAGDVEATFRSMVGGVALRHAEKLHAAAKKKEKVLTDAGVTTVTGAVDTDGIRYKKDPQMLELEERLGKKAADNLDELRKGYEWVITTDGHIACETGDMHEFLFVSEAWLQNYDTSDIYKYLEQARILETLASDKMLAPMVKKLIAFDKEFTGQTDVDAERALMDLLFNKSVYQAFLLSNAGKNMHEFKAFIFQLHEIVKDLGQRSKYHQQLFKGKQAQKRINMLNQIYAQIKETMREPTIKAILNWHIDPQIVGADSVLTERDRQFINQYEQRRRVLSSTGTDRSAYENLAEDIIRSGKLSADALAIIKKSRDGTATLDEEIEARALLDEADRRMTRYDFEVSPEYSYYLVSVGAIVARLKSIDLVKNYDAAMTQLTEIINDIETQVNEIRHRADIPEKLRDRISFWYERSFESDLINSGAGVDLNLIAMSGVQLIRDYCAHIEKNTMKHRKKVGLGALTLPYQVASLIETGDIAGAQFVTDRLNEFENIYGISARQMLIGDLSGMSMTQRNQLTTDMEIRGTDNISRFVIEKLEGMLGGKYVVVPTHKQTLLVSEDAFNVMSFDAVYADMRDTFIQMKDKITEWYQQMHNNINKMSETKAEAEIEHASEIFSGIIGRHSYLSEYLPADARAFAKDWLRVDLSADKAKDVVKWLITQEKRVNTILDYVAEVIKYDGHDNTSLQDFVIVKSIPVDALIVQDILNEDIETRNLIFQNACKSGELIPQNKIIHIRAHRDEFVENITTKIPSADKNLINEFLDTTIKKLEMLQLRIDFGEQIDYFQMRDEIASSLIPDENGNIIDIFTGELVARNDMSTLKFEIFEEDQFNLMQALYDFVTTDAMKLSDFVNIDKFPPEIKEKLENVTVSLALLPPNMQGYAAHNQIVINIMASDQFGTLVHEFNHILQDIYDLPPGFNNEIAILMPDFLRYVTQHYPIYVRDVFINAGHPRYAKRYTQNNITEQDINKAPRIVKEILSYCAYSLVQGELWARAYTHNGKPVHGFAEILTNPNTSHLLSPDGKTKFKVRFGSTASMSASTSIPKETSYTSDVVAGSALDTAIQKLFLLKSQQERRGYAATSRNTYHSGFTKGSSYTMTQLLLNPNLSTMVRVTVKLGDVIRDPQSYLAPEILAMCKGDFSEGNVFYRIKEYVEAKVDGVSIDITDGPNPQYVWVDDNAFDDLLLTSMKSKVESQESTLVTKYKAGEHIPLTEFYSAKELARLGVNPSAYIAIGPDVATETVFDNGHRTGAIFIKANENTTDAKIIDSLNHEFRHMLQRYNGFATGFTPNFKVSREMIEDVKKHVPGLFKNNTIVRWAKALADTKWEEAIVQRFVYYTTSGELNAYAFNARDLYAKPTFVNKEAGNPVIFMPWYDAKTGEGRYQTEYLAMRAEDTETKPKLTLPGTGKTKKYTRTRYEFLMENDKSIYIFDEPVEIDPTRAKGTNLEYVMHSTMQSAFDKGPNVKLDMDLQNFYIATTGKEHVLPAPVVAMIENGRLTKNALVNFAIHEKNKTLRDLVKTYIVKDAKVNFDALVDTNEIKHLYSSNRYFTKKKAEGTNLIYFYHVGEQNQMDSDLQEFIIATTGHEDKLPPELWNVIGGRHKGTLTKSALYKWFRQAKTVNQFTFDLLNKYMFKNNYITSMAELDAMLTVDPSFYWAAAIVLRREGLALESLIAENDVEKFLSFMNSLEGTKWKTEIEKLQVEFGEQWIGDGKGGYKKENIAYSDKVQAYMRVLAMQWFDGTLAGAFYTAYAFRKVARKYEEEVRGVMSIDAARDNAKGDKGVTIADKMTEKNALQGDNNSVGNDILAIYEGEINKSEDEMLQELSMAYYERLCKEAGLDPHTASKDEIMPIAQKVLAYRRKLANLSIDEISHRYAELTNSQITDTQPQGIFKTQSQTGDRRRSIVDRIKRRGDYILKVVQEGKIAFTDLPKEIQDMFTLESATTESGKKTQTRVLKPEVYSVGRGRKKLPGATDMTGRLNYAPKHNITEGNEAFRHDTTKIEANLELLDNIVHAIKQVVGKKKGKGDVKKLYARGEKAAESLADAIRSQKVPREKQVKTTEFKVTTKKKKRTSDTPNVFNIMSGIDMPHVLYKILDTSFEDMANTEVQFASRDESGQLYDKSQFKPGEFDSRVKHEVSNWDAFYEANRDALLSLSRNDVLDIVEFFQRGAMTMDGPTNKLAAFEIFLLGYIVDAARHNINNWNFSDAEIEMVEKLYEQKASAHGSGLQAVQQMLKVVDPMKKVRQRMFDDWTEISDDDKDKLIEAVDSLQAETNADERKKKADAVIEMLEEFGKRQMTADKANNKRWSKSWWARLGSKIKSYRYMAMLSGPTTWIRNVISNVIVTGFNKTSDAIGGIIFTKKGYRKDQWNLAGTKISSEAKSFIDTYILSNPIFNPTKEDIKNGAPNLYDLSSKYDTRPSKKVADERSLLVTLIAKAYEKQYAQDRRFDTKTMNIIAKYIDKKISDKTFVKFVAGRYFGKILTIEAERGNVDLSQGLSFEAMDLFAESVILANIEYMHKRSFAADFLDGIRDKYPAMYEALTFWQPFLNSSFNWFAESFKYTPFGLVASITRMCKLENQISKLSEKRAKGEMVADSRAAEFLVRRDIGKGVVGLMLSVFGIMLACSGRIRIDEDDDKFYLYVDEEIKLDITNLFGSSSVLVGASIAQMWIEQSDGEPATFEEMISLVTDTMLDGFFATDLLERHKWGGTWDDLLTETESVMRSFVPQMWQTIIACTNQHAIRYSPGFKGMWERWLNTFVPTQPLGNRKINPYTGELEDKYSLAIIGGLLQKGILGPKVYWVEVSEIERMCRELGVNKNELTGELTVNNEKFELDRLALNKKYGELNKESLEKIKSQKHKVEMPDGTFKTLSWDKMDDEQRARVISRTMTQNAEIAKIYIWTQTMGKKFYASASLWQMLKRLGITRNVYKGDKGFVE